MHPRIDFIVSRFNGKVRIIEVPKHPLSFLVSEIYKGSRPF